jgi:hypothetical protein
VCCYSNSAAVPLEELTATAPRLRVRVKQGRDHIRLATSVVTGSRATFSRAVHDAIGVVWVESWPGGQKDLAQAWMPPTALLRHEARSGPTGFWPLGLSSRPIGATPPTVVAAPQYLDRFAHRVGVCPSVQSGRECSR